MSKYLRILLIVFFFSFIFVSRVNAEECSYEERTALLNDAKSVKTNVDILTKDKQYDLINPNSEEKETITKKVNYFKINIYNVSENIFVKITNDYNDSIIIVNKEDLDENGMFSFEEENTWNIITYYLTFYSNNNNCYAKKITTKQITKPKENPIHYYDVCSNEKVQDNEYCAQFIEKEFTLSESSIVDKLNSIINPKSEITTKNEEKTLVNDIKKYWYVLAIGLLVAIVISIIIFINKKRGELV